NVDQTVTVTGVDDAIVDGAIAYSIVTSPDVVTADGNYNNLDPADVAVTNDDDDIVAGVTFSLASISMTEGGINETYTVVLNTVPTGDVVINITSADIINGVNIDKPFLTFTPVDWNIQQTVTISAIDDNIVEGIHVVSINHDINTALTLDIDYDSIAGTLPDISVTIADNDISPYDGVVIPPDTAKISDNYLDFRKNTKTTIGVNLTEASNVTVSIYDIKGRKVKNLFDNYYNSGNSFIEWDMKNENLRSGLYFIHIEADSWKQRSIQKIILVK
ncbi:MAG: T9SS type A sorting domain-containing protein, partial [Spirochaetia bacterium]|nr:T9SS type A sorting domain-containing protein [Spirochaetia bacterium]